MLQVKIITPSGLYNTYSASKIHCTTVEGECSLLPNHMPLVAMLEISGLSLTVDNKEHIFAIAGGLLHLFNNEVEILTDSCEGAGEIDLARATASKNRAEQRLAKKDSNTQIRRAEISLQRALNRIKIKSK